MCHICSLTHLGHVLDHNGTYLSIYSNNNQKKDRFSSDSLCLHVWSFVLLQFQTFGNNLQLFEWASTGGPIPAAASGYGVMSIL